MGRKTRSDPTGMAVNRRKSTRRLDLRLSNAEKKIKRLFRAIPRTRRTQVKIVNAESTVIFDYDINDQDLKQLQESVEFIVNNELLETQNNVIPIGWYWKEDLELPYRQGTVEETNRTANLITAAIAGGAIAKALPVAVPTVQDVIFSEPYRKAIGNLNVDGFEAIKSLADRTISQVNQKLSSGIESGLKPSVILKSVTERFNVARSGAKRSADTQVNKAYNDGGMNATDIIGTATGLRIGVIHISALTPTTRDTHAARHGNAYNVTDQTQWWNEGANRIQCKCSTTSVLINNDGKVVESEFQEGLKDERADFN